MSNRFQNSKHQNYNQRTSLPISQFQPTFAYPSTTTKTLKAYPRSRRIFFRIVFFCFSVILSSVFVSAIFYTKKTTGIIKPRRVAVFLESENNYEKPLVQKKENVIKFDAIGDMEKKEESNRQNNDFVDNDIIISNNKKKEIEIENIPTSKQQQNPSTAPNDPPPKPKNKKQKRFPNLAIALKTGSETASTRVPLQLLTFLSNLKNLLLIAEANVKVGGVVVEDVYTGLYDDDQKKTAKPVPAAAELEARIEEVVDSKGGEGSPLVFQRKVVVVGMPQNHGELEKEREGAVKLEKKLVPNIQSDGWKADAHKNLPGFKLLYDRFPDLDWYMMIDDDSYLFLDNIMAHLNANYDPETPIYLGNANNFVGCDGVRKMGDGIPFAHGGSGIIISRKAIKMLLQNVGTCIKKYHDCWAGDVRTALCLRDSGITLTKKVAGFSSDPPDPIEGYWPKDPCQRPFSFHHLPAWQIQVLYDIEQREAAKQIPIEEKNATTTTEVVEKTTFITYADVLDTFRQTVSSKERKWRINSNRRGTDFRAIIFQGVKDAEQAVGECQRLCTVSEKCRSWAYDNEKCWLKEGVPKLLKQNGSYSGVDMGKEYVCVENKVELKLGKNFIKNI